MPHWFYLRQIRPRLFWCSIDSGNSVKHFACQGGGDFVIKGYTAPKLREWIAGGLFRLGDIPSAALAEATWLGNHTRLTILRWLDSEKEKNIKEGKNYEKTNERTRNLMLRNVVNHTLKYILCLIITENLILLKLYSI